MSKKPDRSHPNFRPMGQAPDSLGKQFGPGSKSLDDPQQEAKAQAMAAAMMDLVGENDPKQLASWRSAAKTKGIEVSTYRSAGDIEGFWQQGKPPRIYVNLEYSEAQQCRVVIYLLGRYIQLIENPGCEADAFRPGARIEYGRPGVVHKSSSVRKESGTGDGRNVIYVPRIKTNGPPTKEQDAQQAKAIARQLVRFMLDPSTNAAHPEVAEIKRVTAGLSPEDRERMVEQVMWELFEKKGAGKDGETGEVA